MNIHIKVFIVVLLILGPPISLALCLRDNFVWHQLPSGYYERIYPDGHHETGEIK